MSDTRGALPAPGSDANPMIVDKATTRPRLLETYDHVHDLNGVCLKRRAGARCSTEESADREMAAWLEDFDKRVKPQMAGSAVGMTVVNGFDPADIDSRAALEIGMLLLMGKPLIVVAGPDQEIPAGVERAADAVVRGELGSPDMAERLQAAIASLIPKDAG